MAGEIKSLFFPGPAGRLEALLNSGAADAKYAALVCHPHPMFGGTMHNKVVFAAAKALNSFSFPTLRFNFRGAGLSEGTHDQGRGEQDDIRAALDWLEREFRLPILFAGFSFGAATGLRVCCPDARVAGVISLGTPAQAQGRFYNYEFLHTCAKPKLFISGANDEYGNQKNLEALVESLPEPKKLIWIQEADHFFLGNLGQVRDGIVTWVEEAVSCKQ